MYLADICQIGVFRFQNEPELPVSVVLEQVAFDGLRKIQLGEILSAGEVPGCGGKSESRV